MAHIPVNHPARPVYRAIAGLIALYILIFGIFGFSLCMVAFALSRSVIPSLTFLFLLGFFQVTYSTSAKRSFIAHSAVGSIDKPGRSGRSRPICGGWWPRCRWRRSSPPG